MRGRVAKYFEDKGYGFIKDEKGDSRFFHVSDLVGGDVSIQPGASVNFLPDSNEKGLTCLKVEVMNRKRDNFISIGNTNIKVSNIKDFGVSTSEYANAIEVPTYKINPEYVEKRRNAGKNILKKMFLPSKYVKTGRYKEVPLEEFKEDTAWESNRTRVLYTLPYLLVEDSENDIKEHEGEGYTEIYKDEAEFIYWEYLYISTYQNDNYTFYESHIDIKETLSELKELINN